ncbi:acyl-CoA dehydrogenase family protein [Nocardia donostiensis]|uniref:acyl-CoA dehydrogenase family protein n=1 Tax=Nocardia donostiensis TaxID=1538463 RepID=UPI0011154961
MLARTTRTFVDECGLAYLGGTLDVSAASMAKAHATEAQGEVLDRCLQLFGGYGFMLEPSLCRSTAGPAHCGDRWRRLRYS